MIEQEQLANAFGLNLNIIKWQTEGLTHEDSLRQPPFRGNCLNWVLGHIAASRNVVLGMLGEDPVLSEDQAARYVTDSEPVTGEGEGVLTLEELVDALEIAQERIVAGLQRVPPADLSREIEAGQRTTTMAQRLFGLYFHETYHTGQMELLRQLAGTDDKVI
ncbi:MAG: DinB family protein [Anaerolineae bacterium]